eukprot:Nk52_evm44s217 gene=Nk52_evmTU44s217
MAETFSVYDNFDAVYFKDQSERYGSITKTFTERYGEKPSFIARAPGRVNLIGEHIDYCGYSVMPMAIEHDFVIACLPEDSLRKIEAANVDDRFESGSFPADNLEVDSSNHSWINYFLAGVKGIHDYMDSKGCNRIKSGMKVLISGTVPPGAGLSSSSAFVVASAMAAMKANGLDLDKTTLAEIAIKCERYVGTEGGGMDQAISILAEKGCAKRIDFNPLTSHSTPLPSGACFVIADTAVVSNKAVTAGTKYNVRVVECRIGAKLLAKGLGLEWRVVKKLKEVQTKSGKSLEEMVKLACNSLKDTYTKDMLLEEFGIEAKEFNESFLSPTTQHLVEFCVRPRSHHVYSEALRVEKFYISCASGNDGSEDKFLTHTLAKLMNESHASCKDLYECSCEELDRLTSACVESGAFGSRMTGAGWGGCTVSILDSSKVNEFLEGIKERYYSPMEKEGLLSKPFEECVFVSAPGCGACFIVR